MQHWWQLCCWTEKIVHSFPFDRAAQFLKEQCHKIFVSGFFHQTTSSGPNRQAQERFQIFLNIRAVIRIRK